MISLEVLVNKTFLTDTILNKRKGSKYNRTETQWNKIPTHHGTTCTFKNTPDRSINANNLCTKNIILTIL